MRTAIDQRTIELADQAAAWAVRRRLWRDYDEARGEARLVLVEVLDQYDSELDPNLERFIACRVRQRLVDRWRQAGPMGDRRRAPEPVSVAELPFERELADSAEDAVIQVEDATRWATALASLSTRERALIRASLKRGGINELAAAWGVDHSAVCHAKAALIRRLRHAVAA